MARSKTRPAKAASTLDSSAARLRKIVLAEPEGALLGSEDTLQSMLGVSRTTVRQVARLLEREGLLRVKRGINGGYFGARPDLGTIEASVGAYLEMLNVEVEDLSMVASTLWVDAVRKACVADRAAAKALSVRFMPKVIALPESAPSNEVSTLEAECRTAIFNLIGSRYTELIFQINIAFSLRKIETLQPAQADTPEHRDFVRNWRKAKLMELEAIADGDPELGAMAARHNRNLLHKRFWGHTPL